MSTSAIPPQPILPQTEITRKRTFSQTDMASEASALLAPKSLIVKLKFNDAPSAKQPAKKPDFSNSHDMVTLLVGKIRVKKFVIHKDFACYYSPVFQTRFNDDLIEGQLVKEFELEDVSEDTAKFLVQWIYHQTLTIAQIENGGTYIRTEWCALHQLWVLADKLLIPRLQNAVLRYLIQIRDLAKIVPTSTISYVYMNTAPSSPLRRFVADYCASKLGIERLQASPETFLKEMLLDLAIVWGTALSTRKRTALKPNNLANYDVPEN